MAGVTKTGYVNGSDLFVEVGTTYNATTQRIGDAHIIGHSRSCTIDIQNTYVDIATKPVDSTDRGIYVGRRLTRQSISLSASAFHFYDENQAGLKFFLDHLISGESFYIEFCERRDDPSTPPSRYKPFFVGKVVVQSAPLQCAAGQTVTYEISMLADGKPEVLNANNLHYNNG